MTVKSVEGTGTFNVKNVANLGLYGKFWVLKEENVRLMGDNKYYIQRTAELEGALDSCRRERLLLLEDNNRLEELLEKKKNNWFNIGDLFK